MPVDRDGRLSRQNPHIAMVAVRPRYGLRDAPARGTASVGWVVRIAAFLADRGFDDGFDAHTFPHHTGLAGPNVIAAQNRTTSQIMGCLQTTAWQQSAAALRTR